MQAAPTVDIYLKGGLVSKTIVSPTLSFPVPVSIGEESTTSEAEVDFRVDGKKHPFCFPHSR